MFFAGDFKTILPDKPPMLFDEDVLTLKAILCLRRKLEAFIIQRFNNFARSKRENHKAVEYYWLDFLQCH